MSEKVQFLVVAFGGGIGGALLVRFGWWLAAKKRAAKAAKLPGRPLHLYDPHSGIGQITEALTNAVYQSSAPLFERAEFAGLIHGNGHHMAQELANHAVTMLREARVKE